MYQRLTTTIIALFLLTGLTQPAAADDTSSEATARELMAVMGAGDLGIQVMQQMADTMRLNPLIPERFVELLMERARPEDLVEMVVPIYTKHLDKKTMEAAIAFYRSEEGKRLVAATPVITQESMVAGQQWGMRLAVEIQQMMAQPPTPGSGMGK